MEEVHQLPCLVRDRLMERLRDARVPDGHPQALHLAEITGRAYQTTRRWIDSDAPGLPDLQSFKLLCKGMDCDPSWMLGLSPQKRSLKEATTVAAPLASRAAARSEWLDTVVRDVRHGMHGCQARQMRGEEMDPEIADGDMIFIDMQVCEFDGNGNYLVACDGRELVRRMEYRIGSGLILSCANPHYESVVIEDASRSRAHGLQVLGRIEGVIQVRKFWRASRAADGRFASER
jgi:hypothetical protein